MALRPCLDCKRPTKGTRCPECERVRDRGRGTRHERGYDADHVAARAAWAPLVAAGNVTCRRAPHGLCLAPDPTIRADEPWQLGHPDAECAAPRAPEHRRCNAATAGRIPREV